MLHPLCDSGMQFRGDVHRGISFERNMFLAGIIWIKRILSSMLEQDRRAVKSSPCVSGLNICLFTRHWVPEHFLRIYPIALPLFRIGLNSRGKFFKPDDPSCFKFSRISRRILSFDVIYRNIQKLKYLW